MKFALLLYVAYVIFLVSFVATHLTPLSFAMFAFMLLFGAWFSRILFQLERLNRRMLYREHLHNVWLEEQYRAEQEERQMWGYASGEHSIPTTPRIAVPPRTTLPPRMGQTTAPLSPSTQLGHNQMSGLQWQPHSSLLS